MKLTKENKGITLIALVITIIVLLIVGGVSTYIGVESIQAAEDAVLMNELEQVKHFVGENYNNYLKTKNEDYFIGTVISDADVLQLISPLTVIEIPQEYYLGNGTKESIAKFRTLDAEQLDQLGIENCQNEYIVNYLTGEVFNKTKRTDSRGVLLYTYTRKNFNTNSDITAF